MYTRSANHVLVGGLSEETSERHVGCERSQEHVDEGSETLDVKGVPKVTTVVWNLPPYVIDKPLERSGIERRMGICLTVLYYHSQRSKKSNAQSPSNKSYEHKLL